MEKNIFNKAMKEEKQGKKRGTGIKARSCFVLTMIVFIFSLPVILYAPLIDAQPSPHVVSGYVFKSDGITGAGNIPIRINNTVNGNIVITKSQAIPPFFPFLGSYSATINGSDNDIINITAWNATHYGFNVSRLASTTTFANITLNKRRGSEANVTIILPLNNSWQNTSQPFNLTANVSIPGNDATNCNATIFFSSDAANLTADQNTTNLLGDILYQNFRTTTWNLTGLREGQILITVRAQCASDDANMEKLDFYILTLNINDTTPPIVSLIQPYNNSILRNNITFFYNVSDGTGIGNCSLILNDQQNQTSKNVALFTAVNFTLNNTPEGNYDWKVSCFDNSTTRNPGNSSLWRITIDMTPPNVTLLFPLNNSITSNRTVDLRYNVTDNFAIANCSLFVDGDYIATNYSLTVNQSSNFTHVFWPGIRQWYVNCTDNATNFNASEIFFLNVTAADLMVNDSSLVFSESSIVENMNITINATIWNIGYLNATNITVQFFENDPALNGIQIGTNKSINVTAGNYTNVSETYRTKVGTYHIFVVVDAPVEFNGSIIELNESNNKANRTIDISLYHIFYNDIFSSLYLDTSSDVTVAAWINVSVFTGNIYAADGDSLIEFDSLIPLGRNTSDDIRMNDFVQLDRALNISNYTDSINRTYTFNNEIRDVVNFSIFSAVKVNVSIVNSTNSSNFLTGILWDSSDITQIGFYNGSQDVVFVTKMNVNKLGKYGTYDYEMKVPAPLRRYINPNSINRLSFYMELV